MSVANWKVLQPSNVGIYGPQQVVVYEGKNYDTLLIASNNASTIANNTVTAMSNLAKYYSSQGIETRVYAISAVPGSNMASVLSALGWTNAQCNPIIAWVRGGQIDPVTYSRAKGYTSADLDLIMRNNSRHDPQLDLIPPMGGTTTVASASSVSRFDPLTPAQWTGNQKKYVMWIAIAAVILYLYSNNNNNFRRY